MKWIVDFYHQRRARVAQYHVEAPSPAAAFVVGREALFTEYPPAPRAGRPTLFERAERLGGQDGSGWIPYRIVKDAG
jgi:hypothetical protein